MNTLKERLTSRKFWLAVASIATSLAAAFGHEISWAQSVMAIVATVSIYIGGTSYIEGKAVQR